MTIFTHPLKTTYTPYIYIIHHLTRTTKHPIIHPTYQCTSQDGGHTKTVRSAVFSHDGSFLLSAGDDGLLLLWDVTTGAVVIHFPVDEALPNNKYVRRGLGLG